MNFAIWVVMRWDDYFMLMRIDKVHALLLFVYLFCRSLLHTIYQIRFLLVDVFISTTPETDYMVQGDRCRIIIEMAFEAWNLWLGNKYSETGDAATISWELAIYLCLNSPVVQINYMWSWRVFVSHFLWGCNFIYLLIIYMLKLRYRLIYLNKLNIYIL